MKLSKKVQIGALIILLLGAITGAAVYFYPSTQISETPTQKDPDFEYLKPDQQLGEYLTQKEGAFFLNGKRLLRYYNYPYLNISESQLLREYPDFVAITNNGNVFTFDEREITSFEVSDIESFEVLDKKYAKDKNNIYFKGEVIAENIDTSSFEILNEVIAKSSDLVFFNGKVAENADAKSFQIVNEDYSKDKNNIYFRRNIIAENVDTSTFKIHNKELATSSEHVFYKGENIQDADGKTFEVLNEYYAKDENYVYDIQNGDPKKQAAIDSKSFSVVHKTLAKDNNYVYNRLKVIKVKNPYLSTENPDEYISPDVKSFEISYLPEEDSVFYILKDKYYYYTYYNSLKVLGKVEDINENQWKNPEQFSNQLTRFLDDYYSDGENIYTKVATHKWGENTQYSLWRPLEGAKKESFQIHPDSKKVIPYYLSEGNVYFSNSIISKDAENFQILDNDFLKDSKNVYFFSENKWYEYKTSEHSLPIILKEANSKSFTLIKEEGSQAQAEDENAYYIVETTEDTNKKTIERIPKENSNQ